MSDDERYIEAPGPPDPLQRVQVIDIDGTAVTIAEVEGEIHAFDDDSELGRRLADATVRPARRAKADNGPMSLLISFPESNAFDGRLAALNT